MTAALFAFNGITMAELTYTFDASRQTMYKKLAPFKERGVLVAQKEGRKTYYRMDLDASGASPISSSRVELQLATASPRSFACGG